MILIRHRNSYHTRIYSFQDGWKKLKKQKSFNMKDKIIEILEEHKDVCVEFMGENTAVDENNFEEIANKIIILLNSNNTFQI